MNVTAEDCLRDCEQYISTHSTGHFYLHFKLLWLICFFSPFADRTSSLIKNNLTVISISLPLRHSTSFKRCYSAAVRVSPGKSCHISATILSETGTSEYLERRINTIITSWLIQCVEWLSVRSYFTFAHKRKSAIIEVDIEANLSVFTRRPSASLINRMKNSLIEFDGECQKISFN